MSQRIFRSGPLEIQCGWDEPLQYYYLIIEDTDASERTDEDVYLFSNLCRRNPAMTIDEIMVELSARNITPPATLRADLEADRANRDMGRYTYDTR